MIHHKPSLSNIGQQAQSILFILCCTIETSVFFSVIRSHISIIQHHYNIKAYKHTQTIVLIKRIKPSIFQSFFITFDHIIFHMKQRKQHQLKVVQHHQSIKVQRNLSKAKRFRQQELRREARFDYDHYYRPKHPKRN